jgi:hypothetical protein
MKLCGTQRLNGVRVVDLEMRLINVTLTMPRLTPFSPRSRCDMFTT